MKIPQCPLCKLELIHSNSNYFNYCCPNQDFKLSHYDDLIIQCMIYLPGIASIVMDLSTNISNIFIKRNSLSIIKIKYPIVDLFNNNLSRQQIINRINNIILLK